MTDTINPAVGMTPAEAVDKYRELIWQVAHWGYRRDRGDAKTDKRYHEHMDELHSHAVYGFMKAYQSYRDQGDRPVTGRWHFGGWAKMIMKCWMKEFQRRTRQKRLPIPDTDCEIDVGEESASVVKSAPSPEGFNLDGFTRDLSPDARVVVRYIAIGEPTVRDGVGRCRRCDRKTANATRVCSACLKTTDGRLLADSLEPEARADIDRERAVAVVEHLQELGLSGPKILEALAELQLVHDVAARRKRPVRSSVVRFLQDLGWAGKRIVESFSEIRDALGL